MTNSSDSESFLSILTDECCEDSKEEFDRVVSRMMGAATEKYDDEAWKYLIVFTAYLSHSLSLYLEFLLRTYVDAAGADDLMEALSKDLVRARAKLDQLIAQHKHETPER